jgi:peptidoglycan hydrolase CwlO-like protein
VDALQAEQNKLARQHSEVESRISSLKTEVEERKFTVEQTKNDIVSRVIPGQEALRYQHQLFELAETIRHQD